MADEVGWGVPVDVVAENDVVVEKLARDRQASLAIYVSGRLFASYSADAVIVATPTGSTAYSFSAGGPVLSPQLDAMIFTPVAAHMAFNRSLVLAPDEAVSIRVLERSGRVAVNVDGQLRGVLDPGDWIRVFAGPKRARRVALKPIDFYTRVRDRLGLLDAPAALADGDPPVIYRPDLPVPADMAQLRQPR
jgi:NAD+ kinase